ncbi:bifunctional diaminohydroxyphosphoribosylaminopyrimidine deaminase/5-amino-6-(5-phosphoribosylamino)uracil reductase RibD [Helicobacter muridarum]|uniref:Bifunctional diaminohydroxyphosphoribosylaminopyrimidine deaminase/5-amino-6-(5-phosphoribosylamino)uracil reductase RibD n=1 Tax=Helicobacter muridarum TaxID=216 RepID=A0A377PSZ6_9HELI|nr:bifunctional diaminohydroxyphosphoribosylaminopyrimidine deaminase/5-amino-6-(5-phosphoribosylamino)uracil reductase RibD [Helicobacter muridarum]TLE00055.1 bifunctional diaminohydroxyphosphoribosylaminopyrimidine deaminase/5-amino-6-(5-phosphoribosylamino)uracil reductase RibD [Helicobacter muridarum]STQ86098.1 priboflavin-specific deaminase [Helicobacter muridarum]
MNNSNNLRIYISLFFESVLNKKLVIWLQYAIYHFITLIEVLMDSYSIFMNIAISYAWQFQTLTLPNPAVAALIVANGEIVALGAHYKAGMPHAEVIACKEALIYFFRHDSNKAQNLTQAFVANKEYLLECYPSCSKSSLDSFANSIIECFELEMDSRIIHDFLILFSSGIFHDCNIFVTLEPCNHYGKTPPCANLLAELKPNKIIVACSDPTPDASGGFKTLGNINIISHVLETEARKLLYPFLTWQKKSSFTLFKVAHRLDGTYHGGAISNMDSRIFTHNMRCVADYIVISGETLRVDNPLLDTRFGTVPYSSKLPEIFILSKTIKLEDLKSFHIMDNPDRKVHIARSIDELPSSGFIVIEGGFSFCSLLLKESMRYKNNFSIDCILGYIAPTLAIPPNFISNSLNRISQDALMEACDIFNMNGFMLAYSSLLPHSYKLNNNANIDSKQNIIYWLIKEGYA